MPDDAAHARPQPRRDQPADSAKDHQGRPLYDFRDGRAGGFQAELARINYRLLDRKRRAFDGNGR